MASTTTVHKTDTVSEKEISNLRVDFEGETSKLKLKAENELNETEEKKRNGLKIIKDLIKGMDYF